MNQATPQRSLIIVGVFVTFFLSLPVLGQIFTLPVVDAKFRPLHLHLHEEVRPRAPGPSGRSSAGASSEGTSASMALLLVLLAAGFFLAARLALLFFLAGRGAVKPFLPGLVDRLSCPLPRVSQGWKVISRRREVHWWRRLRPCRNHVLCVGDFDQGVVMIHPIVENVYGAHCFTATDGHVAHFLHGRGCFSRAVRVEHQLGLLHEAVGGDHRVAAPLTCPESFGLSNPFTFVAGLIPGMGLHVLSDINAESSSIVGVEDSQSVEEAIPIARNFRHGHAFSMKGAWQPS